MKKQLLTITVFYFCLIFYSSAQTFQKTYGGINDEEAYETHILSGSPDASGS